MQLHAAELMAPEEMPRLNGRIADSPSPETGALTVVFEEVLSGYCGSARPK